MTARNSRKKRKIEYRRHCIKSLWIEYGIEELADFKDALAEKYDIETSVPTISRDLKIVKERLIDTDTEELMAFLQGNYKFIIQEAYDAWRKSREDKQVSTVEAIGKGDDETPTMANERYKTQERTEGQSGNPALLGQAQNALKAIRELMGTDAPTKQEIDHSGEITTPVQIVEVVRPQSDE